MKRIIISIIFLSLPLFAQSYITVYSGRTSDNVLNSPIYSALNFYGGINLGVSSSYKLTDILSLSPSCEFSSFKFRNLDMGVMPQIIGIYYLPVSGGNLKVYKFGTDLKIISSKIEIIRFYGFTGINYLIEDYPDLTTILYNQDGTRSVEISKLRTIYHFMHDVGIGFIISMGRVVGISLEGKYYSDYKELLRFQANLGFVINLTN